MEMLGKPKIVPCRVGFQDMGWVVVSNIFILAGGFQIFVVFIPTGGK